MSSVNRVCLIGNLGQDSELKNNGTVSVAEFSLATTDKYKGNEKTQWHNVVLFGKTAEALNQYLKKGKKIWIEGSLDYQTWDKKDGSKGYKTVIKGLNVQLLGGIDKQDEKQIAQDSADSVAW